MLRSRLIAKAKKDERLNYILWGYQEGYVSYRDLERIATDLWDNDRIQTVLQAERLIKSLQEGAE